MTPGVRYRTDLRCGLRLLSTREEEEALLGQEEYWNTLQMDDLEAAFELVFGYRLQPPPGYIPSPHSRNRTVGYAP